MEINLRRHLGRFLSSPAIMSRLARQGRANRHKSQGTHFRHLDEGFAPSRVGAQRQHHQILSSVVRRDSS